MAVEFCRAGRLLRYSDAAFPERTCECASVGGASTQASFRQELIQVCIQAEFARRERMRTTSGLVALLSLLVAVGMGAAAQGQASGAPASQEASARPVAEPVAAPVASGKAKKSAYTGPTEIVVLPPAPMLDEEGRQRLDPDGKPLFYPPVKQQRDK